MRVSNDISQTGFTGWLSVNGLSEPQQAAYNKIADELSQYVASRRYLNFYINGSARGDCHAVWSGVEPKYIIMHTQVADGYTPTAINSTATHDPSEILKIAKDLIDQHENSELYKIYTYHKENALFTKIKNYLKKFFS